MNERRQQTTEKELFPFFSFVRLQSSIVAAAYHHMNIIVSCSHGDIHKSLPNKWNFPSFTLVDLREIRDMKDKIIAIHDTSCQSTTICSRLDDLLPHLIFQKRELFARTISHFTAAKFSLSKILIRHDYKQCWKVCVRFSYKPTNYVLRRKMASTMSPIKGK